MEFLENVEEPVALWDPTTEPLLASNDLFEPLEQVYNPYALTFLDGKEYLGIEHYNQMTGNEQMIEMMKCKMSPLYWVEHYAWAPVTGGAIHMGTSEQWKSSPKFRILFKLFEQQDAVLLLSSRQIGKTTLGLMFALHAMIFFPGIEVMFLTLNTSLAKDAIVRMTHMIETLPNWMKPRNASQAAKTTFMDLTNGSKFKTSFISGAVDPDKAGRGLSQPIIILDEFAFCNHAEIVYTAMQPSIATARKFAKQNGYPTLLLGVSTPNGGGDNTFYSMLQNSVSIEDIYDFENKRMYDDFERHFDGDNVNSFISVQIHWSETHRDEDWYKQQCKDLNFNQRRINQELDLAFLGSSTSIFSDDVIIDLKAKKPIHELQLPFGYHFKLFGEIEPGELYLLGADTSASTGASSDFSALSLVHARTGQEVGVWKGKFSIVKKFSQLLKTVTKGLNKLYGLDETTLRVVIERNSFGKGVVEELVFNDPAIDDFDYESYVWQDQYKSGEFVHGFWTGNSGKMGTGRRDQMFSELMNHVNANPNLIHSKELIDDIRNLVQLPSGRIEAAKNQHDDVVMAFNFCLFVRKQMIQSGEIIVDGEAVAFALTPETMNSFIDISLSSGYGALSMGNYVDMTIREDYEDEGFIFESEKDYKKSDTFRLEDYIIGI